MFIFMYISLLFHYNFIIVHVYIHLHFIPFGKPWGAVQKDEPHKMNMINNINELCMFYVQYASR